MMRCSIVALLALAACSGRDDRDAGMAAANFVPPVTQAPEPVAGQRNGTPLTAYVGRYPRDAVDGVSFFDRTEVANAMIEALPEEDLRRTITSRDVVASPVFAYRDGIAAHGCAPHDCEARNWTVVIAPDGNVEKAQVCYHDTATMNDASRWSTRRGSSRRAGGCPQA